MPVVRRNLIANFAGKGWSALISLAFVPLYIWFLGIEAYGLIGVYLTIYGVMSLLDLGMGTTLNRELARYSVIPESGPHMRDLLRTLEALYWSIGILVGLAILLLAPSVAPHWIKTDQLAPDTVEKALQLMGVAIACQWPMALYLGGLMGLQRQVTSNAISAAAATIRSLGAILILWQVSATIEAFLYWQIVCSLGETVVTAIVVWRLLPAGAPAKVRSDLALGVWRFAAGVSAISVFSVILTQLDKIILSGLLSLTGFGYYILATRVSSALYYVIGPVIASYFPRFSQLFESRDEGELRRVYHQSCQLMSVLIIPPAAMLAFFPYEILLLWTQNRAVAENVHLILALLSAGTALNALASPPHVLQLASGWTRLSLINAAASAVLLAPLIYVMANRYGGVGAASVWLLLNCMNVAVNAVFTHRRLLKGELRSWWWVDVIPALLATAAVGGAWKWLGPSTEASWWGLLNLAAAGFAMLAAAAMAAPEIRRLAVSSIRLQIKPTG